MWVFTTDGFYSAVQSDRDPDLLIVRTRDFGDAERLRDALPDLGLAILTWPGRDYAYRLLVPKEAFAAYLAQAAVDIDYPNFKNAVKARLGAARAHLYHDVWSVMYRLQRNKVGETS